MGFGGHKPAGFGIFFDAEQVAAGVILVSYQRVFLPFVLSRCQFAADQAAVCIVFFFIYIV